MPCTEEVRERGDHLTWEETEEYFNKIVGKVFVNELNNRKTYIVPYDIRADILDDNETPIYRIVAEIVCYPSAHKALYTVDSFQSLLETGYTDRGSMSDVLDVLQAIYLDTITALDDVCDDETFADELSELYQREKRKLEDNEEELQMWRTRKTGDALPFPIKKLRVMSPYKMRLQKEE